VHIPDGFLDTRTVIATAVLSATGVGAALRRVGKELPRRKIPLMGLTAAFVFAAQMLNFPVAAGTSGHLTGALLAVVFLGPAPAVLVMTSVLVLQALLFADGGILALGANIFNMGIVAPVSGYAIYRAVRLFIPGERGLFVGTAFASWCSTLLASICCAGELAWSGTSPWSAAFPAMAYVHMLIGVGEALISVLVVASVARARPELLDPRSAPVAWGRFLVLSSVLIAGLVVFVSPFTSTWPDGLERVAVFLGFDRRAIPQPIVSSPFPDYHFPGSISASTATIFAGLIGAILVFLLSFFLARTLASRRVDKAVE
jgi:cobalt/nickel transport system permease protein